MEDEKSYPFDCRIPPIKQLRQTIFNENDPIWSEKNDLAIVWTKPEDQSPSFSNLLTNNTYQMEDLEADVAQYGECLQKLAQKVTTIIHPLWTLPAYYRGNGTIDLNPRNGIAYALMRMNLYLIDSLSQTKNIFFLNTQRWYASLPEVDNTRLWYTGKIPYSYEFFQMAAREICAALNAVYGKTKKLIIVDLDNTLWGGVIGDDGLEGINLGGISPVGEAFADFQKALLALKNRGLLLAIVSKNEESNAFEVFDKHNEMVLKKSDFVGWRINWNDKAANIAELVAELNLGLDSVVFIDDNPQERDRVGQALPQLTVLDWPADPLQYQSFLAQLNLFDRADYSSEDGIRTELYRSEQLRQKAQANFVSIENWLESLEIQLTYQEINPANITRAVQLLNKTNQFNLCTRRMSESEFTAFLRENQTTGFLFNCQDRIGAYGSIGLITFQYQGDELIITDFIVSCRAMGKNIESSMMKVVYDFALQHDLGSIKARHLLTKKNKPCESFLPSCRFQKQNDTDYRYDISQPMDFPTYIGLEKI